MVMKAERLIECALGATFESKAVQFCNLLLVEVKDNSLYYYWRI